MNRKLYPTAEELAAEAHEALARRPKRTPEEYITEMVRAGFINARGEVTRLIGGSAEPEPNYQTWSFPEADKQNKKRAR
jgi:hypothetical protein